LRQNPPLAASENPVLVDRSVPGVASLLARAETTGWV
jgi:hypothetical protein